MAAPTALRLTAEDFTRLGLLTPEEITGKTPVSRVVSLQDGPEPAAASITQYENSTSPKGIRTEYNLVAADKRDAGAVIPEITLEAAITKSSPTESRGFWLPRAVPVEPRTYFSLAASLRFRDEHYKTNTIKQFTVGALQDPADPNAFIVDYVLQSPPDLIGAFRRGGMAGLRQEKRDNPFLPPQQIVEIVRNAMAQNAPLFEKLRDNPAVTLKTVTLG